MLLAKVGWAKAAVLAVVCRLGLGALTGELVAVASGGIIPGLGRRDSAPKEANLKTDTVLRFGQADRALFSPRLPGTMQSTLCGRRHTLLDGQELITRYEAGERDFSRAHISFADLRGVDLRQIDLSGARLIDANLRRANLAGADLSWASFLSANLMEADLTGATMSQVVLHGADLRQAKLRGADLEDGFLGVADLSDADLRDTNLRRANLERARLVNADLRGADLSEASLRGATLDGADLEGVQVSAEQLAQARSLLGARLSKS